MTPSRLSNALSLVLAVCCLELVACGDDDEKEPTENEHVTTSPSCAAIMDVCHAADEGSGPAHDCHDVAHEDVEDDCAARKDACITTCEDALGGAGT